MVFQDFFDKEVFPLSRKPVAIYTGISSISSHPYFQTECPLDLFCFFQFCTDHAQAAGHFRFSLTDLVFAGHKVKVDPCAVCLPGSCPLHAVPYRILAVSHALQHFLYLVVGVFMMGLRCPQLQKYIICVMMALMVMMMVAAAAVAVLIVVMLMMFVIMVIMLLVVMVMIVVIMLLMVVIVGVVMLFMVMVMIVMMMLVIMVRDRSRSDRGHALPLPSAA